MDHLCYLCLVFVMLSRLFIAALWSPAGKGLTSWLSFVMFSCVFVSFPCGILGQLWYFIVLIPDLCHLSYFYEQLKFHAENFKINNLVARTKVDSDLIKGVKKFCSTLHHRISNP